MNPRHNIPSADIDVTGRPKPSRPSNNEQMHDQAETTAPCAPIWMICGFRDDARTALAYAQNRQASLLRRNVRAIRSRSVSYFASFVVSVGGQGLSGSLR